MIGSGCREAMQAVAVAVCCCCVPCLAAIVDGLPMDPADDWSGCGLPSSGGGRRDGCAAIDPDDAGRGTGADGGKCCRWIRRMIRSGCGLLSAADLSPSAADLLDDSERSPSAVGCFQTLKTFKNGTIGKEIK